MFLASDSAFIEALHNPIDTGPPQMSNREEHSQLEQQQVWQLADIHQAVGVAEMHL